jgi:hypothetical protein
MENRPLSSSLWRIVLGRSFENVKTNGSKKLGA